MPAKTKKKLRWPKEVQTAIDYGIDIYALIANLKRTPAERIRRHQIALNTLEKLQGAKMKKALKRPIDKGDAARRLETIKALQKSKNK
jgi:hypothetical protein